MSVIATSMKAVVQEKYGSNAEAVLRFSEAARPIANDDDVVVRVRAASVDRGTWHLMSGFPYAVRLASGVRRPRSVNPGRNFSGTVESVGKDVAELSLGDEVYGFCDGAFAEYARARVSKLARKPDNMTFIDAAAVPVSALTALQALRNKAQLRSGQSVLIVGASGGVGSYAVQIAKALGADVTGVCSTAKVEFVRRLGADRVIDYTSHSFAEAGRRFDVILDIGGNSPLRDLRRVLAPRGRLVTIGGESPARWIWPTLGRQILSLVVSPFTRQRLMSILASENSKDLNALRELIESGKVTSAVDRTFALDEAFAAIEYVQGGLAHGKVVVVV